MGGVGGGWLAERATRPPSRPGSSAAEYKGCRASLASNPSLPPATQQRAHLHRDGGRLHVQRVALPRLQRQALVAAGHADLDGVDDAAAAALRASALAALRRNAITPASVKARQLCGLSSLRVLPQAQRHRLDDGLVAAGGTAAASLVGQAQAKDSAGSTQSAFCRRRGRGGGGGGRGQRTARSRLPGCRS